MIKFGTTTLHESILRMFNSMLRNGTIEEAWRTANFVMLSKSGDLSDPSNWRPIAILPILYKLFSRLLYHRLHPILEPQQCDVQFGFRRKRRIDDVN